MYKGKQQRGTKDNLSLLPIGLKLKKSPSQVTLLQRELSELSQSTTTLCFNPAVTSVMMTRRPTTGPFGGMQGDIENLRRPRGKRGRSKKAASQTQSLSVSASASASASAGGMGMNMGMGMGMGMGISLSSGLSPGGLSASVASASGVSTGSAVSSGTGTSRIKASNFPASTLQIGKWKKVARHEGELIAKCYYAKKKLVWEVLENGVKKKIEINWADISYLNYSVPKNRSAFLEIELVKPPVFAAESDPQPRRHTLWKKCEDFTSDAQASKCKPHRLFFAPCVLNKHIDRLLKADPRLRQLALNARNTTLCSSNTIF